MTNNILINYKSLLKFVSSFYYINDVDFDYQIFKNTVFGNNKPTAIYKKMNIIMDTLVFLICNKNSSIDSCLIKKTFFLLENEISIGKTQEIVSMLNRIEGEDIITKMTYSAINIFKMNLFEDSIFNEITSFIISFYLYFKETGIFLRINKSTCKKMVNCLENERVNDLKGIFLDLTFNSKPNKNYYENLKELDAKTIINELYLKKDFIYSNYHIYRVVLFGSFSKNNERIDSDIDLLISFEKGYTFAEKCKFIERFKEFVLVTFNRYGDILEYNPMPSDSLIKQLEKSIEIYNIKEKENDKRDR